MPLRSGLSLKNEGQLRIPLHVNLNHLSPVGEQMVAHDF